MLPVPLERPERQVAQWRLSHHGRNLPREHLLELDLPPLVRHGYTPFCGDRIPVSVDIAYSMRISPSPLPDRLITLSVRVRCPFSPPPCGRGRRLSPVPRAPSDPSRRARACRLSPPRAGRRPARNCPGLPR